MSRAIGGTLDSSALAALSGTRSEDDARLVHFHQLDRPRQAEAIRRLGLDGMSVRGIAQATGLSIEAIEGTAA